MTQEQAQVEAELLWCACPGRRAVAVRNGKRYEIGFQDGEFLYVMAAGDSWEAAVAKAKARQQPTTARK